MVLLELIKLTKTRIDSQNTASLSNAKFDALRSYSVLLHNLIQQIEIGSQLQYPIRSIYLLLIKFINSISFDDVPSLFTLLADASFDSMLSEGALNTDIHNLLGCSSEY